MDLAVIAVGQTRREIDVVHRQGERRRQPRIQRRQIGNVAGNQERIAAHLIGMIDPAIHLQRGARTGQDNRQRPRPGERRHRPTLQSFERASLQRAGERHALRACHQLAAHL